MSAFLAYSLTASIIMAMLFPVLHQLVNRCTSFRFNRFSIICGIILSLVLPAVLLSMPVAVSGGSDAPGVIDIQTAAYWMPSDTILASVPSSGFDWIAVAVIVYFSGIAFFLLHEAHSYIRLFILIYKSRRTVYQGYTVCRLDNEEMSPFCWSNYIFLPGTDDDGLAGSLFIHEKAHTDERHWIDILLVDLLCIFMWYNPFSWMVRRLVKLNHEFEADSAVIRSGADIYGYQRLLVTNAISMKTMPVADSFVSSKRCFRKRVLMMDRPHHSRKSMLIAVCAVPAVIFACGVTAMPLPAKLLSCIYDFEFPEAVDIEKRGTEEAAALLMVDTPKGEKPDTVVELPSPFDDQKPLTDLIKVALTDYEGEKITANIQIVVGEDGRIKEVLADGIGDQGIKTAIEQAASQVQFAKVFLDGAAISVRYNIPIRIEK